MERIDPKKVLPLLRAEHTHRYIWASRHARGRVLDAACGVGYGAPLLMESSNVSSYTGLDNSQEAIDYARRDFPGENRSFIQGDIYKLPFADASFDTIISLETIEHLDEPAKAIAELARVLKPEGVFLGSVPMADFETKCVEAYGPNEFHKTLFTQATLEKMLRGKFEHSKIWDCWLAITSIVAPQQSDQDHIALESSASWGNRLGSLLFAASRSPQSIPADDSARVYPAITVVEHELKTLTPRDTMIRNQTRMINERNEIIKKTEARVEARRIENEAQARLVDDRDAAIKKQTEMINDRNAAIASQKKMIDERDALLSAANAAVRTAQNRLAALEPELASTIQSLFEARAELAKTTTSRDALQSAFTSAEADRVSLSQALAKRTSELQEHKNLVEAQSQLIDKRTAFIKHLETLIIARDECIVAQTKMIDERVSLIKAQDQIVADRDAAIKAQTALIDERDAMIRSQRQDIAQRNAVVSQQQQAIADLEKRLEDAAVLAGSLQLTITSQNVTINSLNERLTSLGGSLSMVRQELRQHLSDLRRPGFCLKQTTRAMLRIGRNGHAGSEDLS